MLIMVFSCKDELEGNTNVTALLFYKKGLYCEYDLSSLQLPNWLFTLCVIAQTGAGSHLLLSL